jgi:hypothetical protein
MHRLRAAAYKMPALWRCNISTDTQSISAGLRASEDTVLVAVSATDPIQKESAQLRLSPDSRHIRLAADTAADTASLADVNWH